MAEGLQAPSLPLNLLSSPLDVCWSVTYFCTRLTSTTASVFVPGLLTVHTGVCTRTKMGAQVPAKMSDPGLQVGFTVCASPTGSLVTLIRFWAQGSC
jgi:hypothetical protein